MSFSESEIRDYNDYADTAIAEIYPLIKKAVSSHADTYMKKNMLKFKEQGPDERMDLEENKVLFRTLAHVHCDAAITAQIFQKQNHEIERLQKEIDELTKAK